MSKNQKIIFTEEHAVFKPKYKIERWNRNDKSTPVKEYKPTVYNVRKLNPKTEQFETEKLTVNLKLDWENELQLMQEINIDRIVRSK